MIVVFGYVKCDFDGCEAQYDSQMSFKRHSGADRLAPLNVPTGWFVGAGNDYYAYCPQHSGRRYTPWKPPVQESPKASDEE